MPDAKSQPSPDVKLAPHLVVSGASKAIDFYKEAFGAEEMMRVPGPDGKIMHAAITINDALVMLVDEMVMQMNEVADRGAKAPTSLRGTPVTIHLNVSDVDAVFDRAVKAGAKVALPVADQFWGDRYGVLEDPFGHHWAVATHQKEMSEDEIRQAAKQAMCG